MPTVPGVAGPRPAKERKVSALFADSEEPVFADEIGRIRLFRWNKGPKGKEKTRIPEEDFWIDGNEEEIFEFDFEDTDEGDLERQFGRGDYYIDATSEATGRTLPGGHTFSLGGPIRRGGEIVEDDDGGDGDNDSIDERLRQAAAAAGPQENIAEAAQRAAKDAQRETMDLLERVGVLRPLGSNGPSSETLQTAANIHAAELSSLTTSYRKEISEMRTAHFTELDETRKRSSREIEEMSKRFATEIDGLRRQMQSDFDRKTVELKETREDLRGQVKRLEDEKFQIQTSLSASLSKLQMDLMTANGEVLKAELQKEAAISRIAAAEKAAILAEQDADAAAADVAEAEKKANGGGNSGTEEIFGIQVPKWLVPMAPRFLSWLQSSGEPIPPELRGAMGMMGQQPPPQQQPQYQQPPPGYGYPPPGYPPQAYGYPPPGYPQAPQGYPGYAPPQPPQQAYVPPQGPVGGYPPPPPGFPGTQPLVVATVTPDPPPMVVVRRGPPLEERVEEAEEDEETEEAVS